MQENIIDYVKMLHNYKLKLEQISSPHNQLLDKLEQI
jgi:hypothetical protein